MRISDWSSDVCSSDLLPQLTGCEVREHPAAAGCSAPVEAWMTGEVRRPSSQRRSRPRIIGVVCLRLELPDEGTGQFSIGNLRSEEHTSEPQSLMRNSYAVFCLKKHKIRPTHTTKY